MVEEVNYYKSNGAGALVIAPIERLSCEWFHPEFVEGVAAWLKRCLSELVEEFYVGKGKKLCTWLKCYYEAVVASHTSSFSNSFEHNTTLL